MAPLIFREKLFKQTGPLLLSAVLTLDTRGIGNTASQFWIGAKHLGAAKGETLGHCVATDTRGNVYVTGHTDEDLDGNTLAGTADYFLTKYTSSGIKQYTRQLGAAGVDTIGQSVATDAIGNVYVAGYTYGGLDGNTRTGTIDFFVTKYNNAGVQQYTRQLGTPREGTFGQSVATDPSGDVYVAGYTFGGLDGNTPTGTIDLFLTKYSSAGVKQFTRQLGTAGDCAYGLSVATDASGNVYVAGYTRGLLDGSTLSGSADFFVTKYNSVGDMQYTRQLGTAGSGTVAMSVATDLSGNVYVAGYTKGHLDGNRLTGIIDFFVTKYDSAGGKQYTRQLGTPGARTYGQSVATDRSGNVYVAGYTDCGLDGNTMTGTTDFFVSKYNSAGGKQYTRQRGVAGVNTLGACVATDASGNAYVAGYTDAGLDGNTKTGTTFVTKYNSAGIKQ